MGYDMTLAERDPSRDDEHNAANTDFNAAVEKRNAIEDRDSDAYKAAQEEVQEAYDRMANTDVNYFRLNIWGMGHMRDSMDKLGMFNDWYDMPEWPAADDFKVTEEEQEAIWEVDFDDPAEVAKLSDEARAWIKANDDHRAWSPEGTGIPGHKLGSNDGWLVTPEDCESALAAYEYALKEKADEVREVRTSWSGEGATEPTDGNYFDKWIGWLRRAVNHGGFRVY